MTGRKIAVALGVVVAVVTATALAVTLRVGRAHGGPPTVQATAEQAPAGQRVRVEVVNATTIHGLGQRATRVLRDQGFDVVNVSTQSKPMDSTVVLDRSGHPDWARRIAAALGGARVETRPDSSHYVDATVVLGASWHSTSQPFHP